MTDHPHFQIVHRDDGVPVRSRALFGPSLTFARNGQNVALVEWSAAVSLRNSAEKAFPKEAGGLVVGRRLRDSEGDYVAVLNYVQAPLSDGSSGSIVMSANRINELRTHAAQVFPSMDVVGWWHSHAQPSGFSRIDFDTQRIWEDPLHVGLLVFGSDQPWAIAYVGSAGDLAIPKNDLWGADLRAVASGGFMADVVSVDGRFPASSDGRDHVIKTRKRRRLFGWRQRPAAQVATPNEISTEMERKAAAAGSTNVEAGNARKDSVIVAMSVFAAIMSSIAVLLLLLLLVRFVR